MPSSEKSRKELYLAKNLGQLNAMSELPPKMNSTSAKVLVKTAEKMLKEAEHSERMSDEERAYVLYMKYFNVVSFIKKNADYKKQKEYYDSLLGQKNQLNAITKAEGLSESLKQRYEELEHKIVEEKLSSLNTLEKKDTGKDNVKITKDDGLEAAASKETNSAKTLKEEAPPSDGSISSTQLFSLINDDNTQLIIIDIRPSDKFQESHISHKSCINVPADIIPPGTTVTYIEKSLPKDSEALWKQRGNVDHIVILDWNSTIDKVTLATPLKTLKDALFKFDSTVIIRSAPLVLQGGYEQWLLYYPMASTNPTISIPSSSLVSSPMPSLDFDYPNFDQAFLITPSPSSTNDQNPENSLPDSSLPSSNLFPKLIGTQEMTKTRTPTIDRSKKPKVVSQVSVEETLPSDVKKKEDSDSAPVNKTVKSNPNKPTAAIETGSSSNIDQGALNQMALDIDKDLQRLEQLRKQKQEELDKLEVEHKRIILENKARIERMKEEERKLSALEEMKKKQQTDVADLFRMKRNLQETIEKEVKKSELYRAHKEDEEKYRREELERMNNEEEEKKRRQEEVNRLRMDRKKKEENKKRDIERLEIEAVESALREATERARQEEERRLKEQKEAEERAQKLKEEQDDEQRRQRNKEMREQEQLEEERQEKLLEEQRLREKEKQLLIEKEKQAAFEEQKRLAAQKEMEEKKRLEQERLEKERLEKEKVMREKEEMEKAEKAQRQAEEKIRLLKEERITSKTIPSPNLPPGWEKKLDPNTRRYFYINHNSGTTQWEPPFVTPGQGQVSSNTFMTKLKDEPSDLSRYGGGLKRSSSSPNIAKLMDEEVREKKVQPSVDRSKKPEIRQEPVHIVAPVLRRDLNPVYGNVGRGLTGLKNLGNTCYMNSTIQCLNNTSPLISYFLTDDYLHDFNRDVGNQVEVVLDFAVVIKALWSGQYRCITPRDFKIIVGKYQPMFAGYEQQDSQEFLTFLLDGLHEGLNKVKKRPNIPVLNTENLPDNSAAELSWKNHKLMNESIIVELFQGQLKSTLMCLTCKKTSVTFQAFMYLSLPIPSNSKCSLQDCLQKFLQEEKMSGSSRWRCPQCKVERDSFKKIDIWKLPRILLIGLNRFVYDGPWRQKISTYVDFPVQGLDLAAFTKGPSSRKNYKLYGISNHYGTMDGGHYTAFCRNPCTQKWYKFDDHEVFDMSESEVKTSAAFVLYYTSIELTPPEFRQPF